MDCCIILLVVFLSNVVSNALLQVARRWGIYVIVFGKSGNSYLVFVYYGGCYVTILLVMVAHFCCGALEGCCR